MIAYRTAVRRHLIRTNRHSIPDPGLALALGLNEGRASVAMEWFSAELFTGNEPFPGRISPNRDTIPTPLVATRWRHWSRLVHTRTERGKDV